MHNPFDQLAKRIGKSALDASGNTLVHYEIARDAQHADLRHEPDPARADARARLGLLGRIAETLCVIEIFGHAPDAGEIRAALNKHLAHWEEHTRKARARNKRRAEKGLPPEPILGPHLWILAPLFSTPLLKKLGAEPASGWPTGVYTSGEDLLRTGIIVTAELPRDRSTLLLRLMAAGPHLPEAIDALAALPGDAIERTVAEDILVQLQDRLGMRTDRSQEEEDFMVKMTGSWTYARELGRKEGLVEGLREGQAEARARDVLTVLKARGIAVPEAAGARVLAERSPVRLRRWLARAAVARSLDEVLGEAG